MVFTKEVSDKINELILDEKFWEYKRYGYTCEESVHQDEMMLLDISKVASVVHRAIRSTVREHEDQAK